MGVEKCGEIENNNEEKKNVNKIFWYTARNNFVKNLYITGMKFVGGKKQS